MMDNLGWGRHLRFRHLEIFICIVDNESLTEAAGILNMTQPAVSHSLSDIEQAIGLRLCERGKNRFILTSAGAVFAADARRMLGEMRSARARIEIVRQSPEMTGLVRVGALVSPSSALLPSAILSFRAEWPDMVVSIFEAPVEEMLDMLESRDLDLVLAMLDPRIYRNGLVSEWLADWPLRLVVRAGHPLAGKKRVTARVLAPYDWIMTPKGSVIREAAEEFFLREGVAFPPVAVEVSAVTPIPFLLRGSDMITILSQSVADHWCRSGELVAIALDTDTVYGKIAAVWSPAADTVNLRSFRAHLATAAQDMLATR